MAFPLSSSVTEKAKTLLCITFFVLLLNRISKAEARLTLTEILPQIEPCIAPFILSVFLCHVGVTKGDFFFIRQWFLWPSFVRKLLWISLLHLIHQRLFRFLCCHKSNKVVTSAGAFLSCLYLSNEVMREKHKYTPWTISNILEQSNALSSLKSDVFVFPSYFFISDHRNR